MLDQNSLLGKLILFFIIILLNFCCLASEQESVLDNEKKDVVKKGYEAKKSANIIILNKITAKSVKKKVLVGDILEHGKISITVNKCIKNHDPYNLDNLILLNIVDVSNKKQRQLFDGWISSSNQSISTLEHSVYEVIAVSCE